jgi:sporulation protein YlmC with PRC-barrel domain
MKPRVERVVRSAAEGVLGKPVLDAKGQTIGHVVDVLIDAEGRPQAAVIEFAGFLGLGNRDVAVDWMALRFAVLKDRILIHVTLDPAALKKMPLYKPAAKSVPVATPARRAQGGVGGSAAGSVAGGAAGKAP